MAHVVNLESHAVKILLNANAVEPTYGSQIRNSVPTLAPPHDWKFVRLSNYYW